jgi:hypothetical protein
MSSGVHAQDTSSSRDDSTAAAVQAAPAAIVTVGAPPFLVAGVVIAPPQRSAMLVVLDDSRREVGVILLREGESFDGYRLAAVEPARVLLEQSGTLFSVSVGRPLPGPKGAPNIGPYPGSGPHFIPGPLKPTPDLEYKGPQVRRGAGSGESGEVGGPSPDPGAVQNFLERLFSDPQLRQKVEEMRPNIRQSLERAGQDRQALPDASAQTLKPPGGTSP